jgi:glucose-1-phosphate thymidylyltransferase
MRARRAVILSADEDDRGIWPLRPLRRALAPVANTPLITRQLQALHDAGIREVGIVSDAGLVRMARAAIGEAGLDVTVVHIHPPAKAGPAGRLLAAESFIGDGPFVAEVAGSLTHHDLGRSVERLLRKGLGAFVVLAVPGRRTPQAQAIPLRPGGAQHPADVRGLGQATVASANAFIFGSEVFNAARAAIDAQPDGQVDLTGVIDVLADQPGHVEAVVPTGWSKRVDGVEDLLEVNRLVLSSLSHAEVPGKRLWNRVMGPVAIDETATIESSVLNGPPAIGADAHITDSYVGPYTAIGARAKIDGAEIERSVVFPAASIRSVGSRIDGSVIGAGAQLTRQFTPPRALRLWVGQDAHVWLA